ncbi:tRNA (guanine(10)-N(2))-dimethyltransferase [Methanocaldococcus sp.]
MIITEGEITFEIPDHLTITKKDEVFYNPKMKTCRDISLAVIQAFINKYYKDKEIKIADALSGTGIRGLRYAKELNARVKVFLNDINPNAYRKILQNAKLNDISNIEVSNEDANTFLSRHFRFFDIVDIDPFGSPSPYIDQAIRSLKTKNALLCLTATDTSALCGRAKKSCLRKYLAVPLRSKDCHEFALRILAGYAMRMATKYELFLKPIFCHATDHYVRVYLITDRGAKKADKTFKMLGYVKDYDGIKEVRNYGGEGFSGPLYIGNLYDSDIAKEALEIAEKRGFEKRVLKILKLIYDESKLGQIGCYDIHQISKVLKTSPPPMSEIISTLENNGFYATIAHYNPKGIKTNASLKDVIEIILKYNSKIKI